MNISYKDKLFEILQLQGIEVLAYCDENAKAADPLLNNKGGFRVGDMLVRRDNKFGIINDKGNYQYDIQIPIKYDLIFEIDGFEIRDFTDFFNGYDYFCRFAIKVTESLFVFDSYEGDLLDSSFIASKFEKEFYYRDGKVFFIYPTPILKSCIQPFDEIKRMTCERNASAQDCYGNDNCYLAVKIGNTWSLFEDFKNAAHFYLKDFICDNISVFGYYCYGRYAIINYQSKQSLILFTNNSLKELNFQVDRINPIGWCDLNNLYNPENCEESSAFILKCDNKFAILHPSGESLSQFIFDGVLGFINKDTIQVMQYNGSHKLYGEYNLITGSNTPCMFTTPHKNLQR